MSNSLSSVVSSLVRAQMGSAVTSQVTDEDLDREIAKLILADAKKKAERYGQEGISAYLPSSSSGDNVPRTNKRFLTSIIKNTDDHNKTLLRAQALAAQEIKRQKDEIERKERMARAQEAASAASERVRGSGMRSGGWDDSPPRRHEKRRERSWERRDDFEPDKSKEKRRRHRSRSTDRDRTSSRRSRREDDPTSSSSRRRDRSTSRERAHKSSRSSRRDRHSTSSRKQRFPSEEKADVSEDRRHRSSRPNDEDTPSRRSASPAHLKERSTKSSRTTKSDPWADMMDDRDHRDREDELRRQLKSKVSLGTNGEPSSSKGKERAREPPRSRSPPLVSSTATPSSRTARSRSRSRSMSPLPGPHPAPTLPSKMDKYFAESYDPRLDVAPLSMPKVPATGLINNTEFEGWDSMLELIRIRREDREERKLMEKMGMGKDKSISTKKGKIGVSAATERWGNSGENIMEIEYKKKGAVREWDMGK